MNDLFSRSARWFGRCVALFCCCTSISAMAAPLIIQTPAISMTGIRTIDTGTQPQQPETKQRTKIIKTAAIRFTGNRRQQP